MEHEPGGAPLTRPPQPAPLKDVLQRFVELGGRVLDSSPMYGAAESVAGDLAADLGSRFGGCAPGVAAMTTYRGYGHDVLGGTGGDRGGGTGSTVIRKRRRP